ncbi:hypothetical protein [Lactococcus lactis]|uniref:hypothetical protein n=1 Tax=Lactococcus lactis TaxID=1358 RepID=UPI0015D4B248|nr:hypothetical protein [Lactococcus lactis]GFO78182.1 hypothetical protein LL1119B1_02380 [Lactococcus lactis]
MGKYFVTDNERLGLQASQFIHAKISGKYFEKAKEKFPDAKFITVNELYNTLQKGTGKGDELIISKFAKPWEESLKTNYPEASIIKYND